MSFLGGWEERPETWSLIEVEVLLLLWCLLYRWVGFEVLQQFIVVNPSWSGMLLVLLRFDAWDIYLWEEVTAPSLWENWFELNAFCLSPQAIFSSSFTELVFKPEFYCNSFYLISIYEFYIFFCLFETSSWNFLFDLGFFKLLLFWMGSSRSAIGSWSESIIPPKDYCLWFY